MRDAVSDVDRRAEVDVGGHIAHNRGTLTGHAGHVGSPHDGGAGAKGVPLDGEGLRVESQVEYIEARVDGRVGDHHSGGTGGIIDLEGERVAGQRVEDVEGAVGGVGVRRVRG